MVGGGGGAGGALALQVLSSLSLCAGLGCYSPHFDRRSALGWEELDEGFIPLYYKPGRVL